MLPENEHKTASNPIIEVGHLKHGEWELYRSIRLEALQNAPYAFGSNYEREIAFTEEKWKDCAESRATGKESICVIAIDGSRGVGIAGGITPEDNPRVKRGRSPRIPSRGLGFRSRIRGDCPGCQHGQRSRHPILREDGIRSF